MENKINKKVGVIRNSTHLIWVVRPCANHIYNKYQIFEWHKFWDEIKHPTFKEAILNKYDLR